MGADRTSDAGRVQGQARPQEEQPPVNGGGVVDGPLRGRWRDQPERFGKVSAVKQRYYDWIERGVFSDLFQALSGEADMEWLMVASTIVRARQLHGLRHPRRHRHPREMTVGYVLGRRGYFASTL